MSRVTIALGLALIALFGWPAPPLLSADVPVREEQTVYSMIAFNGRGFGSTFARQEADTIYVLAGSESFAVVKKTFVYYWPLMGRWRTEDSVFDVTLSGTLEVEDGSGEKRHLELQEFTYYRLREDGADEWQVALEEEANELLDRVARMNAEYQQALKRHEQRQQAYEELMRGLAARLEQLRKQGHDVSELVDEMNRLEPPEPPRRPTREVFSVPPRPLRRGFVLDLPPGTYQARFLTESGNVLQGSEKRIVAFESRRSGTIGLEVIPGDKWTRPERSHKEESVMYVDGSTDLYLQPFHQREYNDLYYSKMMQNDARGNPKLGRWVRVREVPEATLILRRQRADEQRTLSREPYFVEQVEGKTLGYRIVPYDPEGAHRGKDPSLRAFHVSLSERAQRIGVAVRDADGQLLESASREIRVVTDFTYHPVLLVFLVLPLLAFLVIRLRRAKRLSSG